MNPVLLRPTTNTADNCYDNILTSYTQELFRVYDKDNDNNFVCGMIRNNNGYTYRSIVIHYTIRNNNINVRDDTVCDGGISHNGVDTNLDTDRDLVHYGVVYAYVNAYAVVQLLFYNLQRFDHYDNRHTYDVIYDIRVFNNNNTPCSGHLYNNNGTNNDTPDCISGVENDRSGTI